MAAEAQPPPGRAATARHSALLARPIRSQRPRSQARPGLPLPPVPADQPARPPPHLTFMRSKFLDSFVFTSPAMAAPALPVGRAGSPCSRSAAAAHVGGGEAGGGAGGAAPPSAFWAGCWRLGAARNLGLRSKRAGEGGNALLVREVAAAGLY